MKMSCVFSLALLLIPAVASPQVPSRADLMLVSAHPDDEGIFGGGTLPYYARIRGMKVLQLTMTNPYPARITDLKKAVDVYAGRPVGSGRDSLGYYVTGNITVAVGGLADCCGYDSARTSWVNWGGSADAGRAAASLIVAREIRRFRPRIVVSAHSLQGDYGHSNHKATAVAVVDGVRRAADASENIDGLQPWTADKLFLRGTREENTIVLAGIPAQEGVQPFFHDYWERRLFNGSSARQVTNLGLKQHLTEYYLEPQVATIYCDSLAGTNPNPQANWEYVRQRHAAETWMLFSTRDRQSFPSSTFVINGTPYSSWARGDFVDSTFDFTALESAAPSAPVSTDVSVVEYQGGSLENVGCRQWQQIQPGSSPRRFTEEYASGDQYRGGRYLVLKDGNYRLQVDLVDRVIRKSEDAWPSDTVQQKVWGAGTLPRYTTLFQITNVDKRVNGRNVREVAFRDGLFRFNRAAGTWDETALDGTIRFSFREVARDMWSVLLVDDTRGMRIQIDMHRRWIRFADRNNPQYSDLYPIVTAR